MLTVAVATLKDNRASLFDRLSCMSENLGNDVRFMIVSQLEDADEAFERNGIIVICSSEKGLSKSRNLAIDYCRTEWIWFQDDDINLLIENVIHFIGYMRKSSSQLILVKVGSLEDPKKFYKRYDRYLVDKRVLALRISSIEIIVRSSFIKKNNIRFDENLGLGTDLPSGEENKFFYDCVVNNNANFEVYDEKLCLHTTLIENRCIDHEARYRARGYMLGKVKDKLSPFIMVWWAVRPTKDGVSRFQRLGLMVKTYLRAINSD